MRHEDERETLIRPSTTVPDVERAHGVGWSAVDAVESSSSRRPAVNGVTTYMRVASALFLVGTALCGAGAVAGRSREMTTTSSALGSSNGKGKGRCDLTPQVAGRPARGRVTRNSVTRVNYTRKRMMPTMWRSSGRCMNA